MISFNILKPKFEVGCVSVAAIRNTTADLDSVDIDFCLSLLPNSITIALPTPQKLVAPMYQISVTRQFRHFFSTRVPFVV